MIIVAWTLPLKRIRQPTETIFLSLFLWFFCHTGTPCLTHIRSTYSYMPMRKCLYYTQRGLSAFVQNQCVSHVIINALFNREDHVPNELEDSKKEWVCSWKSRKTLYICLNSFNTLREGLVTKFLSARYFDSSHIWFFHGSLHWCVARFALRPNSDETLFLFPWIVQYINNNNLCVNKL